ncbi:MAG: phosphoribosylamine--glycine ligase [Prevotellaceae bacterium]|jgi:phosphoribosylamine--glycine ligase|nr:phosphoribosylamine--glycine ligase [Prevotellaceae bacterium]
MNILLIGGGGREHALAWKISQSPQLSQLYIAPGNPGTAQCGTNIDIKTSDFEALGQFALQRKVDIVVVGPEDPLANGIVDYFASIDELQQIPLIGPSQGGARLESSKDFAKSFMMKYGVPTARYATFGKNEVEQGFAFLSKLKAPYVLKADGLAAGKGVIISENLDEAKTTLNEMLQGKFGKASSKVVIEEYLEGIEVSVFVLTDGTTYKLLPEAKDYKRIDDGDEGPNTGGMGAVSPVPFADKEFMQKVCTRIIEPTLAGLNSEEIPYKGFIFFGLMNCSGEPYVIEYNVRMGDPETEAVMTRLNADLIDLFKGVALGKLHECSCEISPLTAVTVVAVSGGYPGEYESGKIVKTNLILDNSSQLFHAGTKIDAEGKLVTAGGRVFALTALANSIDEAQTKAYQALEQISFDGKYYRHDIGNDLKCQNCRNQEPRQLRRLE